MYKMHISCMFLCVSMRINRHSCLQSRISLGSAAGTPSMATRFLSIIKGSWGRCLHGCKVSFWPPAKSLPGRGFFVVFCWFFLKKKCCLFLSASRCMCGRAGHALGWTGKLTQPCGPRGSPCARGWQSQCPRCSGRTREPSPKAGVLGCPRCVTSSTCWLRCSQQH